jgi:hypothetical protein
VTSVLFAPIFREAKSRIVADAYVALENERDNKIVQVGVHGGLEA